MSTSDGNSTTRPLRRRTSKRFDRSGGSPVAAGSTVVDATPVEARAPVEPPAEVEVSSPVETSTEVEVSSPVEPSAEVEVKIGDVADPAGEPAAPEPSTRSRTLDQMGACGRCGHEVSTVNIEVDGNVLMMESCDNCDTRRWQLAGEPIELQQALDHVGEHTGRRR